MKETTVAQPVNRKWKWEWKDAGETRHIFKAVNWNQLDDEYSLMFWEQNLQQFWVDTEIPVSDDLMDWVDMSDAERKVFKSVLGGLTLLDTEQGGEGMPYIMQNVEGLQRKGVLSFMQAMEQIHAKSYSTIFTTIASTEEIDEVFEWVQHNNHLQKKAQIASSFYKNILTQEDLFLAMAMSVFLESFLFYSGFFYPLFLAGGGHSKDGVGRMSASAEIISLIIRDESIHGVYVGMLAQELFNSFPEEIQKELRDTVYALLEELYENELHYTDELYSGIGLQDEVKAFIRYNANKALQNLGFEEYFEEEEVNPIVLNGLSTATVNHDFFSRKGNGYVKAKVVAITDAHFDKVNERLKRIGAA